MPVEGSGESYAELLATASKIAAERGSSSVGVSHLVAVLALETSPTTRLALFDAGFSTESMYSIIGNESGAGAGSAGVSVSPVVQRIIGQAHGFRMTLRGHDLYSALLLALIYEPSGRTARLWPLIGVDPERILARWKTEARLVPEEALSEVSALLVAEIHFPSTDLKAALDALTREHPPGSKIAWGWNRVDARTTKISVTDEKAVLEILPLMRSVAKDPSSVVVKRDPPE